MSAGAIAAHYVATSAAPSTPSFTGATKSIVNTRTTQTSTARTGQTWKMHSPRAWQFIDYTCDIRIAGNYELLLNGAVIATVNGVTAAQLGVVFTPAAPIDIPASAATEFKLKQVAGGSIQWYNAANPALTGDGADYLGWEAWQEPASQASTPGTIRFKAEDSLRISKLVPTTESAATFADQEWTVTFDADVWFFGLLKKMSIADTTGYKLYVNGVLQVPSTIHPLNTVNQFGLVLPVPVLLPAGTHTLKIEGSAVHKYWYRTGGGGVPTGDAHTTAWGIWTGNSPIQPDSVLFYELA